jgi:hypothetical protein
VRFYLPKLVANAQDGKLRCLSKFWFQLQNDHFSEEDVRQRDRSSQTVKKMI